MTTDTDVKAHKFKLAELVQHDLIPAEAITRGSTTLTPVARRISLVLPGSLLKPGQAQPDKGFVFIYQRPAGLRVTNGERTDAIPIRDLTQSIILILTGLTALCLWILTRQIHSQRAA